MNIKIQQQLFHWLRNAKQLNIWNLTTCKWDSRNETRKKSTKRNKILLLTKQNETKPNEISLFLLFRETSEISRKKFFVPLCFVFRETKQRMRNGNPIHNYRYRIGNLLWFLLNFFQAQFRIHTLKFRIRIHQKVSDPCGSGSGSGFTTLLILKAIWIGTSVGIVHFFVIPNILLDTKFELMYIRTISKQNYSGESSKMRTITV
jgi:hypothetical protein